MRALRPRTHPYPSEEGTFVLRACIQFPSWKGCRGGLAHE